MKRFCSVIKGTLYHGLCWTGDQMAQRPTWSPFSSIVCHLLLCTCTQPFQSFYWSGSQRFQGLFHNLPSVFYIHDQSHSGRLEGFCWFCTCVLMAHYDVWQVSFFHFQELHDEARVNVRGFCPTYIIIMDQTWPTLHVGIPVKILCSIIDIL